MLVISILELYSNKPEFLNDFSLNRIIFSDPFIFCKEVVFSNADGPTLIDFGPFTETVVNILQSLKALLYI
jgi:hypothetical protein